MLDKDRKTFYSYDSSWEHTFFDERTGGFLVTQLARKYKPMSKKDMETFLKEQCMGIKYASFGFQIEHLNEVPGISSPDSFVRKHGLSEKVVRGHLADFKSTKSANNIVKYAEHAIKDQGADFVLIEFSALDSKIPARIKEMVRIGIHGYFYCDDEKGFHSF